MKGPQLVRFATLPKGTELADMNLTISQDADCCAPTDTPNYLEVSTPDGGSGKYLVISGRWALGDARDIDQLADFLKGVLAGVGEPQPDCEATEALLCRGLINSTEKCTNKVFNGQTLCSTCCQKWLASGGKGLS